MNSFNFEYPYLLLIFPIMIVCLKFCKQKEDAIIFSTLKFFLVSKQRVSFLKIFQILTIFFITISLASPYVLQKYEKSDKNLIMIALDIDISLSIKPAYHDIKEIIYTFLDKRKDDLISLTYFGDSVGIASVLTFDKSFLKQSVKSSFAGALGEGETHLYDSIMMALLTLNNSKKGEKILIVLTDGIDKGSKTSLQELLSTIKHKPTIIYTIGFKDDVNKDLLKQIAKLSNGDFFQAENKDSLKDIFKQIDKLHKTLIYNSSYIEKKQLYQLPLFFAFLSLLFYTYLLNKRAVV